MRTAQLPPPDRGAMTAMDQQPALLLVDDDEAFREAMAATLRKAGYGVVAVADYRDALKTLDSDATVDLMVTDVRMPNRVNGFALARMASLRRPRIKLVYVTAFEVPEAEALGPVLRKPIADDLLLATIAAALASNDPGDKAG
jgi:CheY-like chemotaxis protein